jgi:hypothetical protein
MEVRRPADHDKTDGFACIRQRLVVKSGVLSKQSSEGGRLAAVSQLDSRHAAVSLAARGGQPYLVRHVVLPWCPQVEEQPQQQEDKKGKGKAGGKRFEIKKWNAVAM